MPEFCRGCNGIVRQFCAITGQCAQSGSDHINLASQEIPVDGIKGTSVPYADRPTSERLYGKGKSQKQSKFHNKK